MTRQGQIVVDIDTQMDLFLGGGACCIRNHGRVLARIRRIIAWARRNNIAVISTCGVCPGCPKGHRYLGTAWGQRKIGYTLLPDRVSFPADNQNCLPGGLLQRYRQVIMQKRCIDPFDEPRIDRLLTETQAGEFILIGATIEGAVLQTALGLLQRGKKVTVVTDAVGSCRGRERRLSFRKMETRGARLIETGELAGTSRLRMAGICSCSACRGRGRARPVATAAVSDGGSW